MIDLLKPRILVPVIGDYRLLEAVKDLAVETGVDPDDVYITQNGDCLEYDTKRGQFFRGDAMPGEDTMIDGSGVGDVGNIVLRDREVLSDDGIFIAVVTIDRKKKKIVSEPQVTSRGFVYIKANHKLMNDSIQVIKDAIQANFEHKKFDWTELKQDMRSSLGKFLYKQTNRRPVVCQLSWKSTRTGTGQCRRRPKTRLKATRKSRLRRTTARSRPGRQTSPLRARSR